MTDPNDYRALLQRARSKLPEQVMSGERFVLPDVDVIYEGKTTVWRNFGDIIDLVRREPSHMLGYLLKELGTAGTQDGRRVLFKGRVAGKAIEDRIRSFVEMYVLCQECTRPDTHLVKDGRTVILQCEACGAHRPVTIRKGMKQAEEPALVEGKVYELTIEDIGKRGDGIAKKAGYTIFVTGAARGVTVKVRIEKISNNVAFGVISPE
ncbi:MAG: translation initiation factor IF-2 subunit beta [Euryarchaeota archaeon]|nr:translation initiation factor IF-2 subunit beta [Euryarchaeota archaeon]